MATTVRHESNSSTTTRTISIASNHNMVQDSVSDFEVLAESPVGSLHCEGMPFISTIIKQMKSQNS